jgi:hypothetical protein
VAGGGRPESGFVAKLDHANYRKRTLRPVQSGGDLDAGQEG